MLRKLGETKCLDSLSEMLQSACAFHQQVFRSTKRFNRAPVSKVDQHLMSSDVRFVDGNLIATYADMLVYHRKCSWYNTSIAKDLRVDRAWLKNCCQGVFSSRAPWWNLGGSGPGGGRNIWKWSASMLHWKHTQEHDALPLVLCRFPAFQAAGGQWISAWVPGAHVYEELVLVCSDSSSVFHWRFFIVKAGEECLQCTEVWGAIQSMHFYPGNPTLDPFCRSPWLRAGLLDSRQLNHGLCLNVWLCCLYSKLVDSKNNSCTVSF